MQTKASKAGKSWLSKGAVPRTPTESFPDSNMQLISPQDFDKKRIHKCFHKKTVFEARSCVGLRERLANHPGREQSLEKVERQLVVKAGPNESPQG
ncbi:hypothetical protein FF1_008958 [Malus domestica]